MLLSFVKLSSLVFLKNYTFDPLPSGRKTRSHAPSHPAHPSSDRNFSWLLLRSRGSPSDAFPLRGVAFGFYAHAGSLSFFSAARSGLRLFRSRGIAFGYFFAARSGLRLLRSRGCLRRPAYSAGPKQVTDLHHDHGSAAGEDRRFLATVSGSLPVPPEFVGISFRAYL